MEESFLHKVDRQRRQRYNREDAVVATILDKLADPGWTVTYDARVVTISTESGFAYAFALSEIAKPEGVS